MMGIIWNSIIDHIPVWVWVVMIIGAAGALFYFFSPVLVPLWNITPRPIKIAIGFVISITLAALAGRYRGRQNAEEEQRRRDAEAIKRRQQTHEEVQNLSPSERRKRLDGWVRDE